MSEPSLPKPQLTIRKLLLREWSLNSIIATDHRYYSIRLKVFAEGNYFEPYLHREIEFQSIQDYPPLRELLWPKD